MNEKATNKQPNFKEKEKFAPAESNLEASLGNVLEHFSDFDKLARVIPGIDHLKPNSVKKKEFLDQANHRFVNKRKELKERLDLWIEILESNSEASGMIEESKKKKVKVETSLKTNVNAVSNGIRPIETSFNSLTGFFKNASKSRIQNLFVVNCTEDQIHDTKSQDGVYSVIKKDIERNFKKLDKYGCYSFLIIPELSHKDNILEWAKIAESNDLLLITDCYSLTNVDEVNDVENSKDIGFSNTVMYANWLLARPSGKYIDEPLYIPPSSSVAGLLYNMDPISQGAAGNRHGSLLDSTTTQMDMNNEELVGKLINKGIVPVVRFKNKLVAWGARSMYDGEEPYNLSYPVVRTNSFVRKCVLSFLNDVFGEQVDRNLCIDLGKTLTTWLGVLQQAKIIHKIGNVDVKVDPDNPRKVNVNLNYQPLYDVESIELTMDYEEEGDKSG